MGKKATVVVGIRFEKEMYERLNKLADIQCTTTTNIVRAMVAASIKVFEACQLALEDHVTKIIKEQDAKRSMARRQMDVEEELTKGEDNDNA